MRTAFHRDDTEGGHIVYNATLRAFAAPITISQSLPSLSRPDEGQVERPYRYVRETSSWAGFHRSV
jgi:hypothetical protein